VQTGRARLRKVVVTEQQTVTVPVTREEVRLVREPIADGDAVDATIGEAAADVVLTEERVVVSKETVPVEKARLGTETVTEQQEVTEAVRKEQIEFDDATSTADDDSALTTGTRSAKKRSNRPLAEGTIMVMGDRIPRGTRKHVDTSNDAADTSTAEQQLEPTGTPTVRRRSTTPTVQPKAGPVPRRDRHDSCRMPRRCIAVSCRDTVYINMNAR
jgi:uncharacterized protein (TIGR02271 family)